MNSLAGFEDYTRNSAMFDRAIWKWTLLLILMAGEVRALSEEKTEPNPAKEESRLEEEPVLKVTGHTVTFPDRTLKYHATTGYLLLKEEEGKQGAGLNGTGSPEREARKTKDGLKPKARVFFVAYTLDGVTNPAVRPLAFTQDPCG